jgi:hypothetical protein
MAPLDRSPQLVRNKAQLANLLHNPAIAIVESRNALAGIWVLDIPQPVPDQPPDIKFVVENAGAACCIAVDRKTSKVLIANPVLPPDAVPLQLLACDSTGIVFSLTPRRRAISGMEVNRLRTAGNGEAETRRGARKRRAPDAPDCRADHRGRYAGPGTEAGAAGSRKAPAQLAARACRCPVPLIHPNLAEVDRWQFERLPEALYDPATHDEVSALTHSLIEEIRLVPENGQFRVARRTGG